MSIKIQHKEMARLEKIVLLQEVHAKLKSEFDEMTAAKATIQVALDDKLESSSKSEQQLQQHSSDLQRQVAQLESEVAVLAQQGEVSSQMSSFVCVETDPILPSARF